MSISWANTESISLAHYLRVLNARKSLVFMILFLVLLTTILITAFLPRWYRSTARIKVSKPEGEVALFQARSQAYFDPYFTQEQLEILTSKKILFQVIDLPELNLRKRLGEAFAGGNELDRNQAYLILYHQMVEVDNTKQGTALIDIHVWMKENPQLAAEIANKIAEVYADDRVAFAISGQTEGIIRLKEELTTQATRVKEQRDVVEHLRKEFEISGIDLNVDMLAQEIENLRVLEKNLITLRVEAIGKKSKWENIKAIPQEHRVSLVNSELITDSNIQNLLQAFMVAEQQHARMRSQLGDAHPDLIASKENLSTIKSQLDALLIGYEKALEISFLESQARVSKLEEQLSEARVDQIMSAQSKMRPFEEAVEKLNEEEQIYRTLNLTLRQREIDFQVPKKSIEILNEAVASSRAGRPNWVLNIFLALIVGGSLGIGIALLIEYLDSSFQSVEDMERILELPILGVIAKKAPLIDAGNFGSSASEAYRVVQTNIEFASEKDETKTLVFQSSGPGEGKSTTLHNLAAVMALSGQKVLIIDGDLRRPTQHRILELEKGPGVIDYLKNEADLDTVIRKTDIPEMDILSCGEGHFVLNILQKKRLSALIDDLKSKYDRILIDSPPVIGVSDASVLASIADGVVLIVQHRRNPQSMVQRAKEIIQKGEGSIMGLVLNQVPNRGMADYNYYTANYSYYGAETTADADSGASRKRPASKNAEESERLEIVE